MGVGEGASRSLICLHWTWLSSGLLEGKVGERRLDTQSSIHAIQDDTVQHWATEDDTVQL